MKLRTKIQLACLWTGGVWFASYLSGKLNPLLAILLAAFCTMLVGFIVSGFFFLVDTYWTKNSTGKNNAASTRNS